MGTRLIIPGANAAGLPLKHYEIPAEGFVISAFIGDKDPNVFTRNFGSGDDLEVTGATPSQTTDVFRTYLGNRTASPSYIKTPYNRQNAMTGVAVAGHRTSNMTNFNEVMCSGRQWSVSGNTYREGFRFEWGRAAAQSRFTLFRRTETGFHEWQSSAISSDTTAPGDWQNEPKFIAFTTSVDSATGRLRLSLYVGNKDGSLAATSGVAPSLSGPQPNGLAEEETGTPAGISTKINFGSWNQLGTGTDNPVPLAFVGLAMRTCNVSELTAIYHSLNARMAALGYPMIS